MKKLTDLDTKGMLEDDTKEAKKQRKQFIKDFYRLWEIVNPTKKIFNKSLNDFINVRHISVHETSGHASSQYISTLAIMFLSEILENAIQKGIPQNANPTKKIKKDLKKSSQWNTAKKNLG